MRKDLLLASFSLVLIASPAISETKVYRSYSGGSESAHAKIIRNLDDAQEESKKINSLDSSRARPAYEALNKDITSKKVVKKKVYASRSGSAMAHPKIVIQK